MDSTPQAPLTVQVQRLHPAVRTLGPGVRAGVWVQGCDIGCAGCLIEESWAPQAGARMTVGELVDWVLALAGIEGLTLSGGEPMQQAGALAALVERVRARRDIGLVCYTGYTLEHLERRGTPAQRALLSQVDLLIDGPYVESRHGNLLWRGSANQRLRALTPRYGAYGALEGSPADRSAGVEMTGDPGEVGFIGVPPHPNFRQIWERALLDAGVEISPAPKSASEEGE
jgi:anaerobic ribonucleoside-triphosphate reductase activating protein